MAKKPIKIWVETDTLVQLKKAAILAGRSLSNHADSVLRRGLEGEDLAEGTMGPGIGELLKSGFEDVKSGFRELERAVLDLREEGQGPGALSGYPWTKEQVRHLVYTLSRLDKFFTVYNADWGKNDANVGTRARVANEAGDRAVQKYGLGEDRDGR